MNAVTKHEAQPSDVADYSGGLLAVIERAARDPSVDMDKMERLLEMQERVHARHAKAAFSEALATLQPDLPIITERGKIIVREKTNSGKRDGDILQETSYALWEDINEAVRPLLAEHGFSLSFRTGMHTDGRVTVTGVLSHRLGHSEETMIILPHDSSGSKNAVQAIGSSTSYGKRYTAMALLNITSKGEDDDGIGATPVVHEKPTDAPFPQGPAHNKTALKTMGREFWRDVESCDDPDQLGALIASHGDMLKQLKVALPSWWDGGERDGNRFEGLGEVITRKQNDLAGESWKANPLRAG